MSRRLHFFFDRKKERMVCPCALGSKNGSVPVPRMPKELKAISDVPLSREDIRKGKVRHVEVKLDDANASAKETRKYRRARRPMAGFLSDVMRQR